MPPGGLLDNYACPCPCPASYTARLSTAPPRRVYLDLYLDLTSAPPSRVYDKIQRLELCLVVLPGEVGQPAVEGPGTSHPQAQALSAECGRRGCMPSGVCMDGIRSASKGIIRMDLNI